MSEVENPLRRRIRGLAAFMVLVFVGLAAQLGRLTLAGQGQYLASAEGQRLREMPVFAPRGKILDRDGVELVTNRPAYAVYIHYPYYQQPGILQRLAAILEVPIEEIQQKVEQRIALMEYFKPVRVKDDITLKQYALLTELKNELPGVEVQAEAVRFYPHGELASHLLGYVGEISEEELEELADKGYTPGERIGQTGLEAYYQEYLRGRTGIRQFEVNNAFEPVGEVLVQEPEAGSSLVLTIDAELQAVAERALDWQMWRIRNIRGYDGPWPNAKAGAVVVMDVKTGAVLAMASRPGFDPNLFATGISTEDYAKLQDPILTPMINRAIQKAYHPGSTWKMVTAAAALMEGVIGPYDTIFCSGVYDKAGNPRCWQPWGHGALNVIGALRDSCDIYFYEMGYRLGPDRLAAMARQFGFGSKTGVDLGGEVAGLVTDEETRNLLWPLGSGDPWSIGHTVSSAIGQIVQVTPLQLARYAAALGNGGKLMQPYLVQRIEDADGNTVAEFGPKQAGEVELDPAYLSFILEGMEAVDAPGGTSDYGIWPLPGILTAGKTGTAENPPHDDFGFYVSLVPREDPQIAVAVAIEQAGHGSSVSPVARTIEAYYFGVSLPTSDPAYVPDAFPNDMAAIRQMYPVSGTGL